ncbi:MAG: hypothetical protein K9H26_13575 [Prolixibacteraceae bacterium]|nr:hypothetical protein [Prolixibacteraceae bacterium]
MLRAIDSDSVADMNTYYFGPFVHEGVFGGETSLKYILTPEGRILNKGTDTSPVWDWEYYLKDHLGNVRVVIAPTEEAGYSAVQQETHYYPYGMRMSQLSNSANSTNDYLFNSKQLESNFDLGWYSFGARNNYDPALIIWRSIDPMSENHYNYTGYAYCLNNPVLYIDPFGLDTTVYILDQAENPDNKRVYTADVYVDVDGEINGPYEGSSYPNSDTRHNTLKEGEYSYNNESGHNSKTQKGLNIVNENGERVASGTAPNGEDIEMTTVNIHSGVSPDDDPSGLGRENRGSAGCPTIKPSDSGNFFSNFGWSGANQTTGTSTGKVSVERGAKAQGTKAYLELKKSVQIIPRTEDNIVIPYR